MANALDNPLMASNELSYDFSGFDIDMNDLYEKNARRGGDSHAVWDEEAGQYHLATVAPHSEMDLALSGQTIEDITTVDYSEPVYFVGSGSHEMGEVSRQWAVQEDGTVSKTEGWMTESQLREQWNRKEGMGAFKKANPDMTFDSYFAMIQDGTMRYQEAGGLDWNLAELAADHGIQTTWKNGDGDVFNFTGSGYAKSYKVDDHLGPGGYMKMAIMAGAGLMVAAPLATALTPSLGAAGAKAASSAITNIVKQLVTEGGLDIKDALMSAALSYGGSQLSDALAGSGVLGDIGSKVTDFGNKLTEGGGDILTAAMEAGGMSLVSQLVQEGEIDWKDAALAAAMAGGTTALKGFLSDIGKPDAQDEVLQEISVDAQRKGTQVGDGLWQLDDGTVISDTGNVLGNISNLDLDGDGMLNANDLQDIDVNHDYVDENYTPYQDAYAGKDDVYVDANGRPVDPVGVKYSLDKDGFVDGNGNLVTKVSYGDAYGGNADLGPVDNQGGLVWESHGGTDGVVTFEDGRFYAKQVDGQWIGADGQVIDDPRVVGDLTLVAAKAIDEPLNSIEYFDQNGKPVKFGKVPLRDGYENGQYAGTIFGRDGKRYEFDPKTGLYKFNDGSVDNPSATDDQWYDPITNTTYSQDSEGKLIVTKYDEPIEDKTPVDPQDPDKPKTHVLDGGSKDGGGGGGEGSNGDPSSNGTSGPSGSTNPTPTPTPNPTDYSQIVEIAKIAGTTVMDVIDRLNKGETVDQIIGKGSGTPVQTPGTDTNTQNPPATTNPNTKPGGGGGGGTTDSGGDSTGDTTGGETGGDTSGGGDNTPGDNSGGKDGTSDTGGATEGEDTGGTVTHVLGGGSVAGGVGQGGGPGSGTGTGGGSGNGNGEGNGDGNGNGNGNGDGFGDSLGGGGGGGRPVWGQLFPTAPFQKHKPHQPKVTQRLFQGMDWNR